jgi:hypothetical protein
MDLQVLAVSKRMVSAPGAGGRASPGGPRFGLATQMGVIERRDPSKPRWVIECLERETGFEPATSSLGSWHSTPELLPLRVEKCYRNCNSVLSAYVT